MPATPPPIPSRGRDDPTPIKLANAFTGAIVTHTIPVS